MSKLLESQEPWIENAVFEAIVGTRDGGGSRSSRHLESEQPPQKRMRTRTGTTGKSSATSSSTTTSTTAASTTIRFVQVLQCLSDCSFLLSDGAAKIVCTCTSTDDGADAAWTSDFPRSHHSTCLVSLDNYAVAWKDHDEGSTTDLHGRPHQGNIQLQAPSLKFMGAQGMGVYGTPMDVHETIQVRRALQHINHDTTMLKQRLSAHVHTHDDQEHSRQEAKPKKKKGDVLALLQNHFPDADDIDAEDVLAFHESVDDTAPFGTQDDNVFITQNLSSSDIECIRNYSDSTGMNVVDIDVSEDDGEYEIPLKDVPHASLQNMTTKSRRGQFSLASSRNESLPLSMSEEQPQDMDDDLLQRKLIEVAEHAPEYRQEETNGNYNDNDHDEESSNGSEPVAISDMLCATSHEDKSATSLPTARPTKRSYADAFQPAVVTNPPSQIITSTSRRVLYNVGVSRRSHRINSLTATSPHEGPPNETAPHTNASRHSRLSDSEHMRRWRRTRSYFQCLWDQRHEKGILFPTALD